MLWDLVNIKLWTKGMSSVTLSSHRHATQTSSHWSQGFISFQICKILPTVDCFLSFLIIFSSRSYYKPDIQIGPKNVRLWTLLLKYTMQTIRRKSRADFGICVTFSVPFILIHVTPRARGQRWAIQWQVTKPSLLGLELSHSSTITLSHQSCYCYCSSVSTACFPHDLAYECLQENVNNKHQNGSQTDSFLGVERHMIFLI